MELSDRKKKILQVVVDDYIDDGQPVSSKLIHDKHLQDLSPATIRSELAQLEELGYLGQPHTSAGRVPLPAAYKLYVEQLMECKDLSLPEVDYIQSRFTEHFLESEYLVKSAAKIISEMTEYPAVGRVEQPEDDIIRNIKLVKLNKSSILLIVMTDINVLKDSIITTNSDADEDYIAAAEQILNSEFCGKKIREITEKEHLELSVKMENYRQLFDDIVRVIKEYVRTREENLVVLEGSSNIFKHDEFNDIDTTKNFLSVIDSKQKLSEILTNAEDLEISVKIGKEAGELPEDFALVSAQYKLNGKPLGSAGVIGPIRMDYSRVIRVLDMIGKTIDDLSRDRLGDKKDRNREEG